MKRLLLAGAAVLSGGACAHSRGETTEPPAGNMLTVTDAALRQLADARAAWTFYRNNSSLLSRSAGSGHL
ncbi:MAG: hypothetical protein ACREOG_20950, partial [Gemmatimonadaceae bacterium]